MVTEGGEVDFILRMLQESRVLRDKVRWYTSMFGMLSSVSTMVENLKTLENHNYAVTEFVQGTKTKRWAVAWSWTDWRPAMVGLIQDNFFVFFSFSFSGVYKSWTTNAYFRPL